MTDRQRKVRIETIRERGYPYAGRARVIVDGHDISSFVTAVEFAIDGKSAGTAKLTLVDVDVDLDALLEQNEKD